MNSVKTKWTIPVENIKTVKCLFCEDKTGDVEWAGIHLAETGHHLNWFTKNNKYFNGKKSQPGTQFVVIEKVA
jgi:hypothetical protein